MVDKDIKDIMKMGINKGESTMDSQVHAKIEEIKIELLKIIPDLAREHSNEIPFKILNKKTKYDYQVISDIILNLIMEKKLIGFINDSGTEDLSDDILIIKEKRFLDSLEVEYTTGYS